MKKKLSSADSENNPDREILEAKIAVQSAPSSQALTWKEKQLVAEAVVTGHVSGLKTPTMREALVETMVSLGLTPDYLSKKIKDGLEAETTQFFQFRGEITDERQTPNWSARNLFLKTALKVLAADGSQSAGMTVKAKTFVYKPMLRGGGETVEIEIPKDESVRRRMAAAKFHKTSRLDPGDAA